MPLGRRPVDAPLPLPSLKLRVQRVRGRLGETLGELELGGTQPGVLGAAVDEQDPDHPAAGDRGERGYTTVGTGGGTARADGLGDLGMIGRIQDALSADCDRARPHFRDDAGVAVTQTHGEVAAGAQIERAGQPPHQRQHHLVRPEGHPSLAHQAVERPAHRALASGAAGTLAIADSGVEPGTQLGEMDGRGERVVGAERQSGGRSFGVRACDQHHDRR